ncbi:MAG TPA: hypothetical protein VHL52_05650 [Acidimicrobiia bacterium]|nr:hypothetical protein [Acidimicrobiia bacterium]
MILALAFALTGCSEEALGELGGRSSDWIGEVATTATTTTTTLPTLTRPAGTADWINREFSPPAPDAEPSAVLAEVFARSGPASRYLQASPAEIVAVTPEVEFPGIVPTEVSFVTSQVVIESRELTLADDPTVAFGLWSVEPYSRSRSVGQLAVLNVSRDPDGVELAAGDDVEAVCTAVVTGERLCAFEDLSAFPVWRLEDGGGVVHVWFREPFRYELDGFPAVDEELVHEVIASVMPLGELTFDE